MPLLAALGLAGIAVLAASLYYTRKALKTRISAGSEMLVGLKARVISWEGRAGRVHVQGEEWAATGPEALNAGEFVIIEALEALTLTVKKEA